MANHYVSVRKNGELIYASGFKSKIQSSYEYYRLLKDFKNNYNPIFKNYDISGIVVKLAKRKKNKKKVYYIYECGKEEYYSEL